MSYKKTNLNQKSLQFYCHENITLIDFLLKTYGSTATKIKKLSSLNLILLNDNIIKDLKVEIKDGDIVTINRENSNHQRRNTVEVLFEDEYLVVVNKPAGLLTVSDDSGDNNLFKELKSIYKKDIFICHRLDREVSGVIIFSKSKKVQVEIEDQWSSFQKTYRARVEGVPIKLHDTLTHYLIYSGPKKVIVSEKEIEESVKAITEYRLIEAQKSYADLEILLHTGKKNQIRAQLSYIGHPIVGDTKFNASTKMGNRIALHSYQIKMKHPISLEDIVITAPMPF